MRRCMYCRLQPVSLTYTAALAERKDTETEDKGVVKRQDTLSLSQQFLDPPLSPITTNDFLIKLKLCRVVWFCCD